MNDEEFLKLYKELVTKMMEEKNATIMSLYATTLKEFAIAHSIQRRDVLGLSNQNRNP
jgi:hypothetical protein